MPIEIIVPRLGWSMEEGAFVAWLKQDGEVVRAGEPLFSIEGDKAVQEIESIDSGILRIAAHGPKPGDPIRVGDLLGHLVSAQEPAPTPAPASAARAGARSPASGRQTTARSNVAAVPAGTENLPGPRSARTISPRALRVAAELGVDWTTVTGTGRSGRIRERDIRTAASLNATADTSARPTRDSVATGHAATVLVTGGCGFIGTWVVRELLERGISVIVLDESERPVRWQRVLGAGSERVPFVRGNLLNREWLGWVFEHHHVTHVIHLAALLTPACQANPWEGCRVNVLGSMALFEQVRASAARVQGFSYASSVAVFGDEPDHATGAAGEGHRPVTF